MLWFMQCGENDVATRFETTATAVRVHHQTTGGRCVCARLCSHSTIISFESRNVLTLSWLVAASSAASSFCAADFHNVRDCLASATCNLACSNAVAAAVVSTAGAGFVTASGRMGAGDTAGIGCHNAQPLMARPSATIDRARPIFRRTATVGQMRENSRWPNMDMC